METTDQTYVEMLSALVGKAKQTRHHDPSKGPIDPVGLLLVDEPWVTPREVLNDPAYAGPIPPADLHGKVIEWDTDGLLSRVEHEMLVVGASFSEQIDRVLRQQDGSLSGPVPGGGMVGEVESYLDKGDGPNGPFLMGTIIGLTAGASSYWKKQDAPVALAWTAGAGGLMYLIWKYLAEPSIARATDLDPTTRPSAKKVDK